MSLLRNQQRCVAGFEAMRQAVLLMLWICIGASAAPICNEQCQADQQVALLELHAALDGHNWIRGGWGTSQSHCQWPGVSCCSGLQVSDGPTAGCPLPGGVAGLHLPSNNMTGLWPAAALRQLANSLVFLNVRGNHLYGQIPESISAMQALSVLYLDNNQFSGTLPASINQLGNLTKLTAAANQLRGGVPAGFSRLRKLSWLALDDNQLTGTAPTQLLLLPQLEHFSLQKNRLSGLLQEPAGITAIGQEQAGAVVQAAAHPCAIFPGSHWKVVPSC